MKLFQDLPTFALEKIVCKLSILSKANVLIACASNKKLNSRLNILCKKRRPKFCPICILNVGVDYNKDNYARYTDDIHNQLLNSPSGDSNWVWEENENLFSICDASDDYEYPTGYFILGGQWNYDLMFILNKKGSYHRQILLQHFKNLYNSDNEEFFPFMTEKSLLAHLCSCHGDVLNHQGPISDIETLKDKINETMLAENKVLNLQKNSSPISKRELYNLINFEIMSTYLSVIEKLEKALCFRLEHESKQFYFGKHVELALEIAQISIKNLHFKLDFGQNRNSLSQIRRMLKLYSIVSNIVECMHN